MERVIVCSVCKDMDSCFEEIQDNFSSFMCFNCGFMSDTRYRAGSVELLDNLNKSPQLIQDLQYHDEQKDIVWFPCVINMGELGVIYPDEDLQEKAAFRAKEKKSYVWKYSPDCCIKILTCGYCMHYRGIEKYMNFKGITRNLS